MPCGNFSGITLGCPVARTIQTGFLLMIAATTRHVTRGSCDALIDGAGASRCAPMISITPSGCEQPRVDAVCPPAMLIKDEQPTVKIADVATSRLRVTPLSYCS